MYIEIKNGWRGESDVLLYNNHVGSGDVSLKIILESCTLLIKQHPSEDSNQVTHHRANYCLLIGMANTDSTCQLNSFL